MRNIQKQSAECKSEQAFAAYQAIRKAGIADPALLGNPYWKALHQAAYARFRLEFERD